MASSAELFEFECDRPFILRAANFTVVVMVVWVLPRPESVIIGADGYESRARKHNCCDR